MPPIQQFDEQTEKWIAHIEKLYNQWQARESRCSINCIKYFSQRRHYGNYNKSSLKFQPPCPQAFNGDRSRPVFFSMGRRHFPQKYASNYKFV